MDMYSPHPVPRGHLTYLSREAPQALPRLRVLGTGCMLAIGSLLPLTRHELLEEPQGLVSDRQHPAQCLAHRRCLGKWQLSYSAK